MTLSIVHEVFEPGKDYLLFSFDGIFNLETIIKLAPRFMLAVEHNQCFRLVEDIRKATIQIKSDELVKIQGGIRREVWEYLSTNNPGYCD